ncbi:hypothetical protein D3C86_2100360 [compost metagenome]
MHTNLVRSAGFQLQLDQCEVPETFQDNEMCHGRLTIFLCNGIHLAIMGVAANRRINRSFIVLNMPVYQSNIFTIHRMRL